MSVLVITAVDAERDAVLRDVTSTPEQPLHVVVGGVGPVAAAVAKNLGLAPDAFLMAVAFGAASDFLTPIGHQNSTLVMGPGGYRFGDYWRLGLPLTVMVLLVGTPLILRAWPLN